MGLGLGHTVGSVAADPVRGHEDADDDSKGAEDEEGDGEADLLDRRPVLDDVRGLHHDVVVRDRERVVHVRHWRPLSISKSQILTLGDEERIEDKYGEKRRQKVKTNGGRGADGSWFFSVFSFIFWYVLSVFSLTSPRKEKEGKTWDTGDAVMGMSAGLKEAVDDDAMSALRAVQGTMMLGKNMDH